MAVLRIHATVKREPREPHLCWADPGMNKPYTVYIYIIYVSNMYKHSEYMIHLTSLAWNLGTANHVARHLTLNG